MVKNAVKTIEYYNRYSRKIETEPICGEWFMRLAYGNFLGRLLQRLLLSRPLFSRLAGVYANSCRSQPRIEPFIRRYGIIASESLIPVGQFGTFNDFFCRRLRADARPIDGHREGIIAPADGRYFHIANLSKLEKIVIKGQKFSLKALLGSDLLARKFAHGSAIICRLSPMDYHRFHFPCDGVPGVAKLIPGRLESVHPLALIHRQVFSHNRRYLTRIVATVGEVLMLEVGATFVGSIGQTFTPHRHVKKGAEKGFFAFGGSTVILIFEPRAVKAVEDIAAQSASNRETYVRMGDRILDHF